MIISDCEAGRPEKERGQSVVIRSPSHAAVDDGRAVDNFVSEPGWGKKDLQTIILKYCRFSFSGCSIFR